MLAKTRERLDQFLVFPFQVAVYFTAIILIEAGNRAHKHWKRRFDEDLS